MSVLVCGGAGYIGSHFVDLLVKQGESVVVVDNLTTGHQAAVPEVPFYPISIADTQALKQVMLDHQVEEVLHFCAYSLVGESMLNPLKYFENNVGATNQLLKVMTELDVNRLVFSSTAAVYGEATTDLISEDAPKQPTNPYGESKLMMEKMIGWTARATDLHYIALRYFNVAGASFTGRLGEDHRPETHLIPLAIKAGLSDQAIKLFGDDYPTPDGSCIRDYIHVVDLVAAHYLALQALRAGKPSNTYNLGYGLGYSVKEILTEVSRVLGHDLVIETVSRRPGDPARLVASSDRIRQELGWQPQHDNLTDIIQSAYDWYKQHPGGYDDSSGN